jgi:hypothetical protein
MEVNVLRSCVRNRFGKTKTEASRRPVPLHPIVLNALLEWRIVSPYAMEVDFYFLERQQTSRPRQSVAEEYSACSRKSRHCGQTNQMAQLPSFACDESASTQRRHQGSSGIDTPREPPTTLDI